MSASYGAILWLFVIDCLFPLTPYAFFFVGVPQRHSVLQYRHTTRGSHTCCLCRWLPPMFSPQTFHCVSVKQFSLKHQQASCASTGEHQSVLRLFFFDCNGDQIVLSRHQPRHCSGVHYGHLRGRLLKFEGIYFD